MPISRLPKNPLVWTALFACSFAPAGHAQSVGSGTAAPLQTRFQIAFVRGGFSTLVLQPPLADVHRFGTTGLIQEFYNLAKTQRAALVLADQTKVGFDNDVLQVLPDLYTYYTSVGVNTAGYPIEDTQACPGVPLCTFQRFSNNYALFAFPTGNLNGTQFSVSANFYAKWTALAGASGPLGIVSNSVQAVTALSKVTANTQAFTGGVLFDITSGSNKGLTFSVLGGTNAAYQASGGANGPLGLPLGDEVSLASGIQRQLFEGGRIEYPTGGTPLVLFPVSAVQVAPVGPVSLKSGDTITLTESASDTSGTPVNSRAVTWSTTNGQVASIQASGNVATVRALGSGTALITAASEGKTAAPVLIRVSAPCCGVGEGAPSLFVAQAFLDAVSRNKLSVLIPGPNPVMRSGSGYTQELLSLDGTTRFLLARGDSTGAAYLISGSTLARYRQLNGTSGTLGYPLSDLSATGIQLFEGGAFAGSPTQPVTGGVFTKWTSLQRETGPAGLPVAPAQPFTNAGVSGQSQAFSNGIIYAFSTPRAPQAYFVSGNILIRYLALSGPAGVLGLPTSDAYLLNNTQRQNFENGYIDSVPGANAAQEHLVPRLPTVSALPSSALAGSRVHLSVSGFAPGSTLRVSISNQPDFLVTVPNGAYDWDVLVPASSSTTRILLHAADTGSSALADGAYTITTLADAKPVLAKTAGDNQTGAPGSVLPIPLAIRLTDSAGVPLSGVSVLFTASSGSQLSPSQVLTDSNGTATASLRLPPAAGLAAVNASAAGKLVIFNARAAASAPPPAFPAFNQSSFSGTLGTSALTIPDKGALLTATAALIRFYQNQGLAATPNGLADPNTLNQFLKSYCAPATQVCDGFVSATPSAEPVVNLWRAGAFAGNTLVPSVEDPSPASLRDLAVTGSPILLSLALEADGTPAGGTTVVATGIAADGSLQIYDPNPLLARTSLSEYLNGFPAAGHTWKASLLAALRLIPGTPSQFGFVSLIFSPAGAPLLSLDGQSASGPCGRQFVSQNAAVASAPSALDQAASVFLYCDGTAPLYLLTASASTPTEVRITDLAPAGSSLTQPATTTAAFAITRAPGFTVTAPALSFLPSGVVDAASFSALLAPGGIASVFGSGLSGTGQVTQVSVNGTPALVFSASPFQLNFELPPSVGPGPAALSISSAYGSATQTVTLADTAPAIFETGTNPDGSRSGAVVNQTGVLNSPAIPARRGQTIVVYATGLGAVDSAGRTLAPVTALLASAELSPAYAGLTPGFPGLYQVNVPVPVLTAPGSPLLLALRQGARQSNTVVVAVE